MIKNFTPRLYQETILNTCIKKNTLVVLPTGMGKTNIFLMLAAHRLTQYPNSKILFIGPTRPLIDQYKQVFLAHFDIPEQSIAIFTGHVRPEKRQELWKQSTVIFSTPQGLENDIISARINLQDVSLLGVDESHRAVGDYAYVFVAKQYAKKAKHPRIVALTASPGSNMEKIQEVCKNLFIEAIEVRTDKDSDVKPYIKEVKKEWITVNLTPPFKEIQTFLNNFQNERFAKLKEAGVLENRDERYIKKTDLLSMQAGIRARIASGERDFILMSALSVLAQIMKIAHALELLETQGIPALHAYFEKLLKESRAAKTKAIQNIVADPNFKAANIKTQHLYEQRIEHPKLIELQNIIRRLFQKDSQTKLIIFNQYRDNALDIKEKLNKIPNVKAEIFVGQQKRQGIGLTQKQQKQLLDKFRNAEFNTLVATSIGEEGLDVPKVDTVLFFEPIPSAIRQIQRRGRTGRHDKGRVIILMTKDTRDEAYRWVAHHKELRMYRNLESLKKNLALISTFTDASQKNKTLADYQTSQTNNTSRTTKQSPQLTIYADYREKGSGTIKDLAEKNVIVKLESLDYADYILSSRVGVELKLIDDFVQSIIDGRLLSQIKGLKQQFQRPLVIIEGTQDIFSVRNIHPNAIRGMLSTIAISYAIPILHTKNPKETSALLLTIAKTEQLETGSSFSPHANKKPVSLKDQQEYIISALPGVGSNLAKPLLDNFGSVKNIMNASIYELQNVEKIGPIKAKQIKEVIDTQYKNNNATKLNDESHHMSHNNAKQPLHQKKQHTHS